MPQRIWFAVLAGLLLAGATGGCRPIAPAATLPTVAAAEPSGRAASLADAALEDSVMVTLTKPDATAAVRTLDGRLLIEIESPSGIGAATLAWKTLPAAPPILRLHLGGLEELRLTTGSGELVASVSSSPPHTVSQSARSAESTEFQPLTAAHQEWLAISWTSGEAGAPLDPAAVTFPLQDGYFDVVLRDGRLVEPGTSLEIRWIDFYR